jgi:acyl-coenzyme A thioesterase PaaI-like protein
MRTEALLERMTAVLNDPATEAVVTANRQAGHEAVAVLRREESLLVVARLGRARIRGTSNRFVALDHAGIRIGGVHCGMADLAGALVAWGWGNTSVEPTSVETKDSAERLRRAIAGAAVFAETES